MSQFEEENEAMRTKYSGKQVPMTPMKKGGADLLKKGGGLLFTNNGVFDHITGGGGPDTATVSGLMPSVDGEDCDFRL